MDEQHTERLAAAIAELAKAVTKQTQLFELFVETIPATQEAKLLGVSEWTVRRRRKARKIERLLQ
jgi:FixJ family two-component response regulator